MFAPHLKLRLQLATATARPPAGEGWRHEIKLDGWRIVASSAGGRVRIKTREGRDVTAGLPEVAAAIAALREPVVLDGELVARGRDGVISRGLVAGALVRRRSALSPDTGATPPGRAIALCAFDLLWRDGRDLRGLPWLTRKTALHEVLHPRGKAASPLLVYVDAFEDPAALLAEAAARRLEGIVSKRIDAPYRGGRNRAWLKIVLAR
jgi:bifunctional non-homologous end joining protein LigD